MVIIWAALRAVHARIGPIRAGPGNLDRTIGGFLLESGEDCRGSGEQDDETDPPEPHPGLQGEGGDGLCGGVEKSAT